jgi:hypothetical protein
MTGSDRCSYEGRLPRVAQISLYRISKVNLLLKAYGRNCSFKLLAEVDNAELDSNNLRFKSRESTQSVG